MARRFVSGAGAACALLAVILLMYTPVAARNPEGAGGPSGQVRPFPGQFTYTAHPTRATSAQHAAPSTRAARGATWRAPSVGQELALQDLRIRAGRMDPRYRSVLLIGTSGKVALLFHGNRGCAHELHLLARELNGAGYTVYIPAHPGAGGLKQARSALPPWRTRIVPDNREFPDAQHPTEDMAFVARAMFKARRLVRGRSRIYVAGLSRGGTMAAYAALRYPEQVQRLVLFSPFFDAHTPWGQRIYRPIRALERFVHPGALRWTLDQMLLLSPRELSTLRNLAGHLPGLGHVRGPEASELSPYRFSVGQYYALFYFAQQVNALTARLTVPAQIFSTAREDVVSREAMARFFWRIGGRSAGHCWKEFPRGVENVRHDLVVPGSSSPTVASQVARWTRQFFDGVGQAGRGIHAPPEIGVPMSRR